MALSGTLETFSLPDVLRLLASTKKSGLLEVTGDRGLGRVWVDDGAVVAASCESADDIDGAVFGLLRFVDGSFQFEAGADPDDPGTPREVESVLAAAEALLEEWHEIEAVVPSLDARFRLVEAIDGDIVVTPAQWRIVAAVGGGCVGTTLARTMALTELEACRELRSLIETGLAEVDERTPADRAVAAGADPAVEAARTIPAFEPPAFAAGTIGSDDWQPPERLGPDAITADPWAEDDAPLPEVLTIEVEESLAEDDDPGPETEAVSGLVDDHGRDAVEPFGWPADDGADDDVDAPVDAFADDATDDHVAGDVDVADEVDAADDDDKFLSQLSNLSPKAAAAIEATAADGDRAADDTPAAVDEQDFLSSLLPSQAPSAAPAVDGADAVAEEALPGTAAEGDDTQDVDGINQNLLLKFLSSSKP